MKSPYKLSMKRYLRITPRTFIPLISNADYVKTKTFIPLISDSDYVKTRTFIPLISNSDYVNYGLGRAKIVANHLKNKKVLMLTRQILMY